MNRIAAARVHVLGCLAAGAAGGLGCGLIGGWTLAFHRGGVVPGLVSSVLLFLYVPLLYTLAGALGGIVLGGPSALAGLLFNPKSALAVIWRRITSTAALALSFSTGARLMGRSLTQPDLPTVWIVLTAAAGAALCVVWWIGSGRREPRSSVMLLAALGVAAGVVAGVGLFLPAPQAIPPGGGGAPRSSSPQPQAAARRALSFPPARNVVLIVIDTLRADHLSCYGYPRLTSPSVDRLAASSVRFDRVLVQKGQTSPSMASILSGTYAHTHGLVTYRNVLPDDVLTIAEVVQPRGWSTAGFQSNPNLTRKLNFSQGFSDYQEFGDETLLARAQDVTDHALPWIEAHRAGPFFLYLHYLDPHTPYDPPAPFRDRFRGDALDGRFRDLKPAIGNTRIGTIHRDAAIENGSRDVDLYVARYDEEIAYVDHEVGRVVEKISALGLDDDTLLVLTSDHGESLYEHQVYCSHDFAPYQDTFRVPLMLRYPRAVQGPRVQEEWVESIDLAPTILEALGLPVPPAFEGSSLWPLLLDETPPAPRVAFSESGYKLKDLKRFVIAGHHKLLYNPEGLEPRVDTFRANVLLNRHLLRRLWWAAHQGPGSNRLWELYDLEADPGEMRNLVDREPAVLEDLKVKLEEWMARAPEGRHPRVLGLEELSPDERQALKSLGYLSGSEK